MTGVPVCLPSVLTCALGTQHRSSCSLSLVKNPAISSGLSLLLFCLCRSPGPSYLSQVSSDCVRSLVSLLRTEFTHSLSLHSHHSRILLLLPLGLPRGSHLHPLSRWIRENMSTVHPRLLQVPTLECPVFNFPHPTPSPSAPCRYLRQSREGYRTEDKPRL